MIIDSTDIRSIKFKERTELQCGNQISILKQTWFREYYFQCNRTKSRKNKICLLPVVVCL